MIHHHFFMPKRADFTQEQFSQYYRREHIKAAGDQRIPALVRYVQSHRVAAPPSEADFSAVAEVWYESEAALTQFTASPALQQVQSRRTQLRRRQPGGLNLTTVDHVILDGERVRAWVKGMFMIKRKPESDGGRFPQALAGWFTLRSRSRNMDIRRYVQCHTIDSVYNFCEPQWDGISHLWFDDAAAAERWDGS